MSIFKEAFEKELNRPVLSVDETIDIAGVGNGIKSKQDTGNDGLNVLHGVDHKIDEGNISFTTINNKSVSKPLKGTIKIHIGSGIVEDRPVVEFDIRLNGKIYKNVAFSLADRSKNEEPVLIGAPFIKKLKALVDVSR